MFANSKAFSILVPALAGLGLAGAAFASASGEAADGSLHCEIRTSTQGGMFSVQGVVTSDAAVEGTYSFTVESAAASRGTTIHQGGGFSAAPGKPAMLGKVMVGPGGIYDASLEISAGGATVACDERVGGSL